MTVSVLENLFTSFSELVAFFHCYPTIRVQYLSWRFAYVSDISPEHMKAVHMPLWLILTTHFVFKTHLLLHMQKIPVLFTDSHNPAATLSQKWEVFGIFFLVHCFHSFSHTSESTSLSKCFASCCSLNTSINVTQLGLDLQECNNKKHIPISYICKKCP